MEWEVWRGAASAQSYGEDESDKMHDAVMVA